jgi:hypothetical protein
MKTIIGKRVLVKDNTEPKGVYVGGVVIDKIAGTEYPKRVRLMTGEHSGEVRMLDEYKLAAVVI